MSFSSASSSSSATCVSVTFARASLLAYDRAWLVEKFDVDEDAPLRDFIAAVAARSDTFAASRRTSQMRVL